MRYRLLLLLTMSLITACNGGMVRPANSQLPAWFNEPDIPGYLGISVSAPVQSMGGLEGQRRVALSKARAELGRITRLNVQSSNVISQTSNKEQTSTDFQNRTRISSTETLDVSNMQVKEEWVDPATNELYIWVLVPKK